MCNQNACVLFVHTHILFYHIYAPLLPPIPTPSPIIMHILSIFRNHYHKTPQTQKPEQISNGPTK